jgi:hypothetical protein
MPDAEPVGALQGKKHVGFIGQLQFMDIPEPLTVPFALLISKKILQRVSNEIPVRRSGLYKKINIPERV